MDQPSKAEILAIFGNRLIKLTFMFFSCSAKTLGKFAPKTEIFLIYDTAQKHWIHGG